MPNITNNSKPACPISVRFALLSSFALLLFVGTADVGIGDVSSPTSRISSFEKDDADKRQASLFPGDGRFLASLRFWEKNQDPPQKGAPQSATLPKPDTVARPGTQTSGTSSSGTASASTEKSEAPLPQLAATETSLRFELERDILGDAPLPRRANGQYDSDNGNGSVPPGAQSGRTSYVSYSFDTRDWVESFHHPQEQNTAREGIPGVTQKTSLRFNEPPTPLTLLDELEANEWNGHATELVTHRRGEPRSTVAASAVSATSVVAPVEKPLIDLTPSYQKRLQYVQTCGVVVVQANFPLTEIKAILEEVDQLQHDLKNYIGVLEPMEKIELCLFKDEDSYSRFLREFFPRAPTDRRALYIKLGDKPGTLLVQRSNKDFEVDLRHEMTHAIIHASIPTVPIWLDEGLAKYFEVPSKDRHRNNPYMTKVRFDARLGTIPSMDRLARLETIDDMSNKEYRESWAWTHFLIHHSPETQQLLAAYLQMLATWSPQEEVSTGSILGRLVSTQKRSPIPSLKLYLDDIMPNQREAFKEHFGAGGK